MSVWKSTSNVPDGKKPHKQFTYTKTERVRIYFINVCINTIIQRAQIILEAPGWHDANSFFWLEENTFFAGMTHSLLE